MVKHITRGIALAVPLFLVITACSNDQKEVQRVVDDYEGPLRVQKNVEYTYTDSGIVQLTFIAPEALDFSHLEEEEAHLEFPQGIHVTFYGDSGVVETTIRANYAIQYIEDQEWKAEGDVVVNNAAGEMLETERLFWKQKTQRISSDVAVAITTKDSKIWGKGFDADQSMKDYEIHEVIGTIYLDETESDSLSAQGL